MSRNDSYPDVARIGTQALTLARETWPHMSATVDIDVHTANFGAGPHFAILLDRSPREQATSTTTTITAPLAQLRQGQLYATTAAATSHPNPAPNPIVWYRTMPYSSRCDALREVRHHVEHMSRIRRWADDVCAKTAGKVTKRLPLRQNDQEMREHRKNQATAGEKTGCDGA